MSATKARGSCPPFLGPWRTPFSWVCVSSNNAAGEKGRGVFHPEAPLLTLYQHNLHCRLCFSPKGESFRITSETITGCFVFLLCLFSFQHKTPAKPHGATLVHAANSLEHGGLTGAEREGCAGA